MSKETESNGTAAPAAVRRLRVINCEVYSRVVGYYRPIQDWNKGKQEEFADRRYVDVDIELFQ